MKKILFVSLNDDPFSLAYGGSQRTNLLLQACAACGTVDVICFQDLSSEHDMGDNVRIIYGQSLERLRKKGFQLFLNNIHNNLFSWRIDDKNKVDSGKESIIDSFVQQKPYDWIVTRYMNHALSMGLIKYADRLVVDIDDSPVDKAMDRVKTASTLPSKVIKWLYVQGVRKAVRSFTAKVAVTFFSNPLHALKYNTRFLPNIPFHNANIQDISFERISRGRLLFVGLMSYYPNYLGMDHFLTHIYPYLDSTINWEIHICGRDLDESYQKKWSTIKGVRYLGFVEDLSKEYSESEIVIVPIYHGSGTCIKVLEAMQMHRMVITTPKGARGYDGILASGEDYLLANNDKEYISLLNKSINNIPLQTAVTEHASKIIENRYNRSAVINTVKNALL